MTVDEKPPPTAVARYRAEMNRKRAWYYAAIGAAVVALVVAAAVAWSHGEITHTTIRTAAKPAPSIGLQAPSATLTQAWTSPDHTASGRPVWGGTVVTYDAHSVRGRDAATGAITWAYTRKDRRVCSAAQTGGVTVAIFELAGNCDQVTTLDSATGQRKWTRTLDEQGQPLNGRAAIQIGSFTILFTTPSVVYGIDPNSGIDRWVFSQKDCTVRSAVLGSSGALISQSCDRPDCSGKKFCGSGPQLLLRDGTNSRNDSDGANPDRIKWNLIGNTAVPVSADELVSALEPDGRLDVLDPDKGTVRSTLTLSPAPASIDGIDRLTSAEAELVHIGTTTYAIKPSGTQLWSAQTPVLPSVTAPSNTTEIAYLATGVVAVPTADGLAVLDGTTGKVRTSFPVGAPPEGSRVYPLGTGFVVAGPTTTVYR